MRGEVIRSNGHVVGSSEGKSLLSGFVVHKLIGETTGGAFSIVEHNLQPHMLAAPMHTHRNVDEYSYVLEGEIGAQIGDQVIHAGSGALVVKPKGVPHTFWNASSRPARILEIIAPAGLERYFEELDALLVAAGGRPNPADVVKLADEYGMDMDFSSLPELMATYNVTLGG